MSDGLILWSPNGEPADGTIQAGTLGIYQDNNIMKQKDSDNIIKNLAGTELFDFVVDVNGSAGFTTIQAAVDAAELRGTPASILILAGTYVENVTIVQPNISIHGFSEESGSTDIDGDISVTVTTISKFSFSEFFYQGELSLNGTGAITFVPLNMEGTNSGGSPALRLTNTNSTSTMIPINYRCVTTDDLSPALIRGAGSSFNIDGTGGEWSRNGSSNSALPAIDYSAGGGGLFRMQGSSILGQILLDNSSCLFTFKDGQIVTNGTVPLFSINSFGGAVFLLEGNVASAGGGADVFSPSPNLAQFFFANVITGTGTRLDTSMATRFKVDGTNWFSNTDTGSVGLGGQPDATSILQLDSTSQTFVMPRMTTIQRDAIVSPLTGAEIYNLTTNEPEFFDGSIWLNTGGTSAAGPDRSVQFNNNGSFDGIAAITIQGGNFNLADSAIIRIGDNNDFDLFHNGVDSFLQNKTGLFVIQNESTATDIRVQNNSLTGKVIAKIATNDIATSFEILGLSDELLFKVDGAGNVGIGGEPFASSKLHVESGDSLATPPANSIMTLESGAFDAVLSILSRDGFSRAISFGDDVDNNRAAVHFNGSTNNLELRTNGSQTRLTVTEAGNIGIGTTSPSTLLDVNGDMHIAGNFIVDGTKFINNTETVNISDNHLFLNAGHTTVSAQTGGLVVNYLPTSTLDTVATGGFTAGVDTFSDPQVITVGSATFSANDIIQISITDENGENNGLFEVFSHIGTTLIVRGIGINSTVEDFTDNQFITNTAAIGAITKINVGVSRIGTDGRLEQASGDVTGFTFAKILDATNITAANAEVLFLNGTNIDGISGVTTNGTSLTVGPSAVLNFGTSPNFLTILHNGTDASLVNATGKISIHNANVTNSTDIEIISDGNTAKIFNKLGTDNTATQFDIRNGSDANLLSVFGSGQVGIGTGASPPDNSAILQIDSTTRGLLIPRVTEVQRDAIPSPATGLQIFNLDDLQLEIFDGSTWKKPAPDENLAVTLGIGNDTGGFNINVSTGDEITATTDLILNPTNNVIMPVVGGNVGMGTSTPDVSAILDVNSSIDIFNILTGTVDTVSGNTLISGIGTGFTSELVPGQQIKINSVVFVVDSITNDSIMFVVTAPTFSGFGFDLFGGSKRGFLMPRMTTTERDSIPSPATGLEIYNTTTNQPEFFDGTIWKAIDSVNNPGGANTQIQFNNNGAFDGFAGLTTNGTDTVRIDENTALKFGEVIAGLSIGHNTLNSDIVSSIGELALLCTQSGEAISLETNNGGVVINASIAEASAELTIVSTTKGFLMPRMTTTQRDALVGPVIGLEIFNTTTLAPNFFNGILWQTVLPGVESLAVTLTAGNITGGTDIVISSGDKITTPSGTTGVTLNIISGTGSTGDGGPINLIAGNGFENGGPIQILAGGATQAGFPGAGIEIAGGNGIAGNSGGGPVEIDGGIPVGTGEIGHVLLQSDGGNVGINTSTPLSRLTVVEDPPNVIGTWTIQTSAANNEWESCTFGNNLFVAVSITGGSRVMTSPDGIIWTSGTIPAKAYTSVAFGNNTFIAVAFGSSTVATSPDGIVWTDKAITSRNYSDIAFGNGTFVAVADNPTANCETSTDNGETWTTRTLPANKSWSTVTFGNGTWVICARGGGADGSAISTDDGVTWSNIGQNLPSQDYRGSTFGDGLFVAVSTTGTDRVQTSPDGITWTGRTAAAVNNWISIDFGNGIFMAVSNSGTGNRAMSSTDGINWVTEATPADNSWRCSSFGDDLFISVATSGIGNRAMSVELTSAVTTPILDLQSTVSGFLPPRMTTGERDNILSPVAGLEIYENLLNAPMFHDGTQFQYGAPVAGPNILRVRQLSDLPTPDINDNINIIANTVIYLENSVDLGVNNILPAGRISIFGVSFGFTTLTSSNADGTIDKQTDDSVTLEDLIISNTNPAAIAISLNNSGASLFARDARFFGEIVVSSFQFINMKETQIFSKLRFTPGATGIFNVENMAFIQFAPINSISFEQGSNVFSAFITNTVFITAPGGFGIVVENPDSLNVGELETSVDQGAGTFLKCDPISSSSFTPVTGNANEGVAIDSDGNLIIADSTANTITRMVGLTNVVDVSIAAPSSNVRGVVWLKGDLYSSDNLTNLISRHAGFSTTITSTVLAPGTDLEMLTTDGTNLIYTDATSNEVTVLDGFSTTIIDSFSTPAAANLQGVAFDGINLIISDSTNDDVHVLLGISGTGQYSFAIAAGAVDFVDIVVTDTGFIGSDFDGNDIHFYDHPVTFDHSSRSWLVGSAAGFLVESSDRGGSQYEDDTGGGIAITVVQNIFTDIAAIGIFYGSFSAMEKVRLNNETNGELIWTGTRDRGRTISASTTITRSGSAANRTYKVGIFINNILQKDSVASAVLPDNDTFATINTLPITRDLVAGKTIKVGIVNTTDTQSPLVVSNKLSIT